MEVTSRLLRDFEQSGSINGNRTFVQSTDLGVPSANDSYVHLDCCGKGEPWGPEALKEQATPMGSLPLCDSGTAHHIPFAV